MDKIKSIEQRLDESQNEYFGILTGFLPNGNLIELSERTNRTKFVYNWERMKDLQRIIYHLSDTLRMESLERAKEQLERAFTPELRKMLNDKVLREMDNNDESDS